MRVRQFLEQLAEALAIARFNWQARRAERLERPEFDLEDLGRLEARAQRERAA